MAESRSKQIFLGVVALVVFGAGFQWYLNSQEAADALDEARSKVESALTLDDNAGLALRESIDLLSVHPEDSALLTL